MSAIVSSAEGNILGKSTSKIVHLACYSLIILILASMLTGIVTNCIACVNRIKRQIEIITPILATLTVLTGGTSSAAIYQPSAIFLSGGAVEIVSGFIFPAAIAVIVLNFMSKLNPQMSFSGVTTFVKSIMKWVIGITVTVFSIFYYDAKLGFVAVRRHNFQSHQVRRQQLGADCGQLSFERVDMLSSAGLLIKSSVGLCGIILLLFEIIAPIIALAAFSLILKLVGAIMQPIGENVLYQLLSDLSKDIEYFIAGY